MKDSKFSGVAVSAGNKGGTTDTPQRLNGTISVAGGCLVFASATHKEIRLPLADLIIQGGGSNGGVIYFSSPAEGTWKIHTRERKILNALGTHDCARLAEKIQAIRGGDRKRRSLFWVEVAVVIGLGIGLWTQRAVFVSALLFFVPHSADVSIGSMAFSVYEQGLTLVEDQSVKDNFKTLTDILVTKIDTKDFEPIIHIAVEDDINAFALPGGIIVFNSGLLMKADTAEEVLGVLAHELSHVTKRHSMQALVQNVGLSVAIGLIVGDTSGLATIADQFVPLFIEKKFSRDHERDADNQGFTYLKKAGISADGLLRFFKRLKEITGSQVANSQALSLFSTHPLSEERINSMSQKIAAQSGSGRPQPLSFNYGEFKETLRQYLETQQKNK